MTTNAVNYMNNKEKLAVEKEIADLDRKVDFAKLGISKEELMEKIRHNEVDEYLTEKKVNADDRNGFMNGLGSILKGIGLGGAVAGLAAAVNDESYHNKLTVAYEQATKLPFSEKAGNPWYWDESGWSLFRRVMMSTDVVDGTGIPNSGVIEIKYVPTIAVEDQEIQSSELQNNVRLLFTKVRESNSGAVNNYDQSDLFQFTLASSNVFEILRLVVRPLNYINAKRKNFNVFTAWDEHILSVMTGSRANARKIIHEKTEYIQAINSCIRSNNAQALPIGFDLTKRRSLLNGRIFSHDGDRDEIYIFNPTCYYVYKEADAMLECKQLDLASVFSSPENVANLLKEMLQPLVNGTATSIMAGDMKKAFKRQVGIIREIPYALKGDIWSKDENVLESIRNGNIMLNIPTYGSQLNIKQGVNTSLDTFIYQGELTVVDGIRKARLNGDEVTFLTDDAADMYDNIGGPTIYSPFYYKNLMDIKNDNPVPYDIMSSTRFKTSFYIQMRKIEDDATIMKKTVVYQWGTEIINRVICYYFDDLNQYNTNTPYSWGLIGNDLGSVTPDLSIMFRYKKLETRFHYLPMLRDILFYDPDLTYFYMTDLIHGRYNGLLLTDTQLLNLHNASFGSLISIKEETQTEVE